MSKKDVAVVDYGIGNLLSVKRGLEHCGADVIVTSDKKNILKASRVVLPGVGAFADGMRGLKEAELLEVVCEVASRGKPLMGICLGMQMLLNESEEFGFSKGLGLIPGKVVPIPKLDINNNTHKIPHIGWSELSIPKHKKEWNSDLMNLTHPGDSVYFVHSFMAQVNHKEHEIANCYYGGISISAVIGVDNIYGCQFHPEKSGEVGLKMLKSFVNL